MSYVGGFECAEAQRIIAQLSLSPQKKTKQSGQWGSSSDPLMTLCGYAPDPLNEVQRNLEAFE